MERLQGRSRPVTMTSERRGTRIVPVSLGIAMLAVVVLAGLTPNTGVVQAASGCTYGQCVAPATFPTWAIATSVALVVVALLVALLILRRRRTPPPPAAPVSEWSGGPPAGAGGPSPPAAPSEWEEASLAGGVGAGAMGAADWREPTPVAPPEPVEPETLPTSEPLAPAPAAEVPKAAEPEAEPDIDSLMQELDKISSEILKRTPKKRADTPSAGDAAEDPPV